MIVSNVTVSTVWFVMIYAPLSVIALWKLFPKLKNSARFLPIVFLLAQITIFIVDRSNRPKPAFLRYLWGTSNEYNIPSYLSSTQWATVAAIALVIALFGLKLNRWQRSYFILFGFFMLFAGLEEFFDWKSTTSILEPLLTTAALALALSTAIATARVTRQERTWFLWLLACFALVALGTLVIDKLPEYCGSVVQLNIPRCINFQRADEWLEDGAGWMFLVVLLGMYSGWLPNANMRSRFWFYAVPPIWIGMLLYFSPANQIVVPHPDISMNISFENGVDVYGYKTDEGGLPSSVVMKPPFGSQLSDIGYSVHVIDQETGGSIASTNRHINRREEMIPKYGGLWLLYRQPIDVVLPSSAPANRAMWAVLTLWREQDGRFIRQKALSSDQHLLSDTQVILGEFVLPAPPSRSPADPIARFNNGFTLEAVTLPESARAGENLSIEFTWRSDVQGSEDHAQFLHLGHVESGEWWGYDQEPLGPRLPTRLWYSGLADNETWQIPLPANLAPGRYDAFTGLCRVSDKERVPVTDADGRPWLDNRVELGSLTVVG